MTTKPTWQFITELTSIIGVFLICFVFLHNQIRDLDTKMDTRINQQALAIQKQCERTDKLYEMFLDLRKDMDNRFQKTDQKFYDLLKDQKKT